jgi:hypothetical protein
MNLNQHARVLWKHRTIVAAGLAMGLVLAVLAAFHVPSMERRGSETWRAESNILVTQPGFPEGRVTLPETAASGGQSATGGITSGGSGGSGSQRFADPTRLSGLALLYAVIAHSDQVRAKLPERPAPGQIRAVALDATGNGTTFLPIIQLTTTAGSAAAAERLNVHAFDAFKGLLESEQEANDIEPSERIRLDVLNHPGEAALVQGRSLTASFVAFLLCMLATVALVHLLEGLSLRLHGVSLRPAEEDGAGAEGNGQGAHERVAPATLSPGYRPASSSRRATG